MGGGPGLSRVLLPTLPAALRPLSGLWRRFGGVVFSSVLSLGGLVLVNLLLPRSVTPEVFGEWRKVVLAMVPVGVVHLGMADALFKAWAQRTAGPLGVMNVAGYLPVIVSVSALHSAAVFLIGLISGNALPLFFAFAVLSGLYAILLSRLLAEQTGRLFVLRYSAQPLLILLLLGLGLALGRPTVVSLLGIYVLATGLAALLLLPGTVVRGRQELPAARQLILNLGGLHILVSNLLFLALINVDKFVLSFNVPLVEFANYNLMSTVVLASGTVFSQVGNALYAKGEFEHGWIRGVLLGVVVSLFALLFVAWNTLSRAVATFFPQYDVQLFALFLPASALMSMISVYYLPLLKYSRPRVVSVLIVITLAVYLAAFFALRLTGAQALRSSILSYSVALGLFVVLSELWSGKKPVVGETPRGQ